MSFFQRLKNFGSSIESAGERVVEGLNPFNNKSFGSLPNPDIPEKPAPQPATPSQPNTPTQGKYKSWDEVPWYERATINAGSAVEDVQKKALDFVGLGDYGFSGFTDEKNKIKTEIKQKGSSDGADLNTFLDGTPGAKINDMIFNDQSELDEDTASSLKTGASISGGGVNQVDNLPNRLGLGGPSGGSSIGKPIAIDEEPALQDQNYNRNNFSF